MIISAPGAYSREFQNPRHVYLYRPSSFSTDSETDVVEHTASGRFGEDFSLGIDWIAVGEPNYRPRPDSTDGAVDIILN
jgi:hypothetical protein